MREGGNENLDPAIACVTVAFMPGTPILLLLERKAKKAPPGG